MHRCVRPLGWRRAVRSRGPGARPLLLMAGGDAVEVTRREVFLHYVVSEMSKEIDRTKAHGFAETLSDAELIYLVRTLSRSRRNAVEEYLITRVRTWELVELGLEDVAVTDINDEVKPLLQANGYNLDEIASDEALCRHREFDARGRRIVDERTIGIRTAGRTAIVDGMHRIIRMACDGKTQFEVYVGHV